MKKTNIEFLDLKKKQLATDLGDKVFVKVVKNIDTDKILDSSLNEGSKIMTEVAADIRKSIESNSGDAIDILVHLNGNQDYSISIAQPLVGYIVQELVSEELRGEKILGFATIDQYENFIGGDFNLLQLINYKTAFDYIRITCLTEDGRAVGLGVLVEVESND